MATTFHSPGHVVSVTAPADVLSDAFVVIGSLFGIAQHNATSGQPLELGLGGVWRVAGLGGTTGAAVYHDGSALTLADGGGANTRAGVILAPNLVRLNGSF